VKRAGLFQLKIYIDNCAIEINKIILFYNYGINLKGLGHTILGNFSTDRIVIELTRVTTKRLKTIEELNQNTGQPSRDMDGQNLRGLKWIALG